MHFLRSFAAVLLIALLPVQGIGAVTLAFCPDHGTPTHDTNSAQDDHSNHEHQHGDASGSGGGTGLDHCGSSNAALPAIPLKLSAVTKPVLQPAAITFSSLFIPDRPQRVPLIIAA